MTVDSLFSLCSSGGKIEGAVIDIKFCSYILLARVTVKRIGDKNCLWGTEGHHAKMGDNPPQWGNLA